MQGVVFRPGDARFDGRSAAEIVAAAVHDPTCVMVNRNQGSGTRILIDRLLATVDATNPPRPGGYFNQPTSHNAVAAAIKQGRADWGLAIESAAGALGLGFIPYQGEQFDFVVPSDRKDRPAVQSFISLLSEDATRRKLIEMGLHPALVIED
jgi:putative molybdopterin biosynthesis protein